MIALVLATMLAAVHPPCYADGHNARRSEKAKTEFKRAHPCPGGPDKGSVKKCSGYVIDHWCALACCGLDEPSNMK